MSAGEPIFWTWIRILRRVELGYNPEPSQPKKRVGSGTVQHVAMVAVTYGDPDGTRIRPSEARLARVCRLDPKTVRGCLARLREVGLLVRVRRGGGRAAGRADEYHLAIPSDLADRVAMLDPDERTLIVPDGVEPPPTRKPRAKKASPAPETPGGPPAERPVDNPVGDVRTPGAAPGETPPPTEKHRVLHAETPGAASLNTGCSTRPPTQRPTKDQPTLISSPYGAEVEGKPATRREPPAKDRLRHTQPPLLGIVHGTPDPDAETADTGADDYEQARDTLGALPDLGAALLAQARATLGPGTPLRSLVIHAATLARRPA